MCRPSGLKPPVIVPNSSPISACFFTFKLLVLVLKNEHLRALLQSTHVLVVNKDNHAH